MADLIVDPTAPKVFISYSWDDDAHSDWVERLATRLREDGVDVTLDLWHAAPGDQLPGFMEKAVRENDFVIAVCTPSYKRKMDRRDGRVSYEGDVVTAYVFTAGEKKKFIPVLRRGSWNESAPSWLLGMYYINLSDEPYSQSYYKDLLRTLHKARKKAPPIGLRPDFESGDASNSTPASATPETAHLPDPAPTKSKKPSSPKRHRGERNHYIPRPRLEQQVVDQFQHRKKIRPDGPRIVTLRAEGGMGKTRLARRCAEQLGSLFPDGVHFVSLTTTLPSEEAVAEAIGRALGLPAPACLPAKVLEYLQGRTTLLVLDNYEAIDDPDHNVARYLVRIVAEAPGLRLLVTGRSAVDIPGVEQIIEKPLEAGMTPVEARDLFLHRARLRWAIGRELTDAEEPQLVRILDLTANIPLAIELAAAWAGPRSLQEIANGLAKPLGKVNELPTGAIPSGGEDRHESLTRSLDWSYDLLGRTYGQPAQALFATCGLFADSFDEPTLATVADIPAVQDDLIRLTNASLVRRLEADDGSTRYRLHRFTREYALRRLDEDPAVAEETRRRLVAHYALLVKENAPDPNDLGRYAVLDREWRNALAALQVARTFQDTSSLLSMLSLGQFLHFRGLWFEAEFLYHQILAGARAAGDSTHEGIIYSNTGIVYGTQGRYDEALDAYAQALAICRKFSDRVGQGQTLNNMGIVYEAQGRYDEASDAYAESLAIRREFGDRVGEGRTLVNMGLVYQAKDRYDEALDAYAQALAICREFRDRVGEGQTLIGMGNVHTAQGRFAEALDAYAQALAINRAFRDRVGEGQTLIGMSNVHTAQGRYAEALDALAQALAIRREFGDRVGQGQTLKNLALLAAARGDLPEAIRWARETVAVLETTEATMDLEKARRILTRVEGQASDQDSGLPGGDGD